MSDIIQLLPDYVANQIAAGEVVQRPASIVKELLENAVDAEATQVELIVREAGRNLVQVVDNGIGMSETDAKMAFERHATSKIRSTEDIFRIASKGFRGEALASIAAVAQVELKTKKKEAVMGTNIYIEGGEIQFQEPIQTGDGANFAVKNLFYNVPARRKFLKNNNVEFRHIIDEFQRVVLAHPDIAFDLFHNDEIIFKLRKGNSLQRIVEVFGRKLQPLLVPIKEELDWITLGGYVAKPEGARKSRGEQFFFVNGRFFKSAYLNKAVQEAFEGVLMPGYHPSFFLFLEIDAAKIDVNIHPQKTEVKFEDENLIFALIRSTVKRALGIYNITPSLDFDRNPQLDSLLDRGISHSSITESSRFTPSRLSVDRNFNPFSGELPDTPSQEAIINLKEMYDDASAIPSKINLFGDEAFDEDLMRLPNGYWLINKGEKTLMLDLSRIHQILMMNHNDKAEKTNLNQQSLLFSLEYHLNEGEKNKYRSIKKYLPKLGYGMTLVQDNVLRIDAIPNGLKESQVIGFLEHVFEVLDYRTEDDFMAFYQEQWDRLNVKSRFDFIYKYEVEELLKQYKQIGFPEYTPDGKRCFIELPLADLKNKF